MEEVIPSLPDHHADEGFDESINPPEEWGGISNSTKTILKQMLTLTDTLPKSYTRGRVVQWNDFNKKQKQKILLSRGRKPRIPKTSSPGTDLTTDPMAAAYEASEGRHVSAKILIFLAENETNPRKKEWFKDCLLKMALDPLRKLEPPNKRSRRDAAQTEDDESDGDGSF